MRVIGKIKHVDATTLLFELDGDAKTTKQAESFSNELVVLEISKYYAKKSLSANNYFWHLVQKIAKATRTDAETVYLQLLRDAGTFVPVSVIDEALTILKNAFKITIVTGKEYRMTENGEECYISVNCYKGVSEYNSSEMAHLIDYTVQEAVDLGIDVMTQRELERLYGGKCDG